MKKIVLALTFVLVGSFMLAGCSKDEILNHYNNMVQSAGSIELTGKSSLQGEKEKGIDDYTGTYTADYANFSGTEYLFGGTSIKREAGKELSIDCTLEITEGTAKVFWISGSDEAVTLIEATGTYSDTITLPDGGNYIGIECENFTGNIELNIECCIQTDSMGVLSVFFYSYTFIVLSFISNFTRLVCPIRLKISFISP